MKNSANGRQRISQPMRIVAPISKNPASKAKFATTKKYFILRIDFTPFMSKSLQIWDHFFPLLFLKNSANLKSLDIALREVEEKHI